jgi:hypothetical protein
MQTKLPVTVLLQGIFGQKGELDNNDKNTFHLPWQHLSKSYV